jgi:ligand-binding SRPBCC domain-containing protein
MKTFSLQSEIWLPQPLEEVFAFFSDARNLERLTPPWLRFEVLTPDAGLVRSGMLIDYRLRLHGFPIRWRSKITAWEPPHRFVDEQRHGPYRLWVHEHTFQAKEGGTLAVDNVEYAVLGGALVNRLFVAPDLRRVFAFRRKTLLEIFAGARSVDSSPSGFHSRL